MQRFYLDLGKIGPPDRGRNTLLKRRDGNNKMFLVIELNVIFVNDMVLRTCQTGSWSSARSVSAAARKGFNARGGQCSGVCDGMELVPTRGSSGAWKVLRIHAAGHTRVEFDYWVTSPCPPIMACLAPFHPSFSERASKHSELRCRQSSNFR